MNHDPDDVTLDRLEADQAVQERISGNLVKVMKVVLVIVIVCCIALLAGCSHGTHCWVANTNRDCGMFRV